nr:dual specificity protein kinase zak2 [Quercus suber]
MEESFFAQVARRHSCRGHQAAQCIRNATSLPTRSSEGGFVIGDLLPTNSRLRECLRDVNQNLSFLQCTCSLCLPTTKRAVRDFDIQLAQAIANPDKDKDGLRRCFAVLALAGGHFTFRAWDACSTGGELLPFLNGFLHPGLIDSNLRLFAPLVDNGKNARQLAEQFIECVRGHCWLTDIPRFDIGTQSKVFTERKNLPFTHLIPVPSTGTRPGKLFRKIRIDPDYTDSDVLKRLSFAHNDEHAKEDAQREVDNLFDVKRLGIPGVAELLLAFTTFDDRQQHKHLIFHLYDFDLEQVLLSRSEDSLPPFFQWSSSSSVVDLPLSRHPLWESAMDLLLKIARIHNPPQQATGLEDGLILQVAHLDLKPANIVIDKEGKLLLIDLEHAIFNVRVENETSGFDGRAGTFSYAPPEGDLPQTGEAQHRYGRSYDVWSLGCVLLEIMTCILCVTRDGDSVAAFRAARSDDSPGEQHSAFWRRVGTSYEIKDAVKRKIEIITAEFGPRVAGQIRKMLAIEKSARPKSLQDCITEFTSQGDLDELTFVRKNEIAIFATRLSNVSFEFDTTTRSLTLVLLCGDQNRRVAVPLSGWFSSISVVHIMLTLTSSG